MLRVEYRDNFGNLMKKENDPSYIPFQDEKIVFDGREYYIEEKTFFTKFNLLAIEVME